jgi:hypothetical protein
LAGRSRAGWGLGSGGVFVLKARCVETAICLPNFFGLKANWFYFLVLIVIVVIIIVLIVLHSMGDL